MFLAALGMLVLVSCGVQGAPQYEEVLGAVASPCAIGTGVSDSVQHCTAHVVLVNKGGEGIGHVTLVVPLKNAVGAPTTTSNVLCGRTVPELPSGGHADIACNFDLPPGKVVATWPSVYTVDFVAASTHSSSGFDFSGAATFILAGATVLLALAMLVTAPWRRPVTAASEAGTAEESVEELVEDGVPSPLPPPVPKPPAKRPLPQPASSRRADIDSEYDLPSLPGSEW